MANENIIRHDVIQLDFISKSALSAIDKLQSEMDDIRSIVDKLGNSDGIGGLGDQAKKTNKHAKTLSDTVKKLSTGLTTLGKKATVAAYNGLKKVAAISFKGLVTGIGLAAGAISGLVAKSVSAFAEFEQLKGGVETLFGTQGAKTVEEYAKLTGKSVSAVTDKFKTLQKSQKTVLGNANNAYKTTGLSANAYMETVTSFSASLIQSLNGDTEKAAEYAHTAIVDMSDNANKMGTDIGSIQYAYQGFAKQNYTMLDNLKLGYGGTKSEMQRLIKDAAKIDKSVKKNDMSYGNIVLAIHAIQKNMGILGTTQKEAEKTVTGSLNSMQAAWGNLLTAMGSGEGLDDCINNMVSSVEIFGKNVIPVAEKALGGIGTLVERLSPVIADKLPALAEDLLPPLIKASVSLATGLYKALPGIIETTFITIVDIARDNFPIFDKIGEKVRTFFKENGGMVKKFTGILAGLVGAFYALGKIKAAGSALSGLFGGFGGASEKGGKGKGDGIFGTFSKLAKMSPKTVTKGMANLAIIIGGFALISAALMKVAPHMAELSDGKSLVETISVVAAVGVLGAGLSKLGAIVGKIPVATVAKGLANMAIMIGGLTAIGAVFAKVAPYIADLSDNKSLIKLATIITALGGVGTVLSVFAGIAGAIPIPVVLAGLANIALVVNGMTALIAEYALLSKIDGFNNFIKTGGDTLALVFEQIGKIGGSMIGGFGEAMSESLPKIGKNLAQFGKNIKPLFDAMKGIDLGGVGAFFGSLVGLLGIATGNEIVERVKKFFGDEEESSLEKLGTQLTSFANNSKGFFNVVAKLPENGFSMATQLFNCLAGVKNLPKEGGVVGWFKGEINYESLATGLGQLANEKVTGFFNAVSGLKQEGFDNAKKLFDTLAGMKSLPKEGGVVGWFAGEVDYSKIATGLGQLGGEGIKKFFAMTAQLKQAGFDNATKLFECLAGMGDLTSGEGFWERLKDGLFGGDDDKTTLSIIAKDLGTFGEKAGPFFAQVNSLNLGNLNGLWESLRGASSITTEVSKIVGEDIADIVKQISDLPNKMAAGLKASGVSLGVAMAKIWKDAVLASVSPVNKLISGANWVMKEFGSEKRVAKWQPYANGTNGHKGGNALVNDGRGAELVQMPNGNAFIPNGKNVFIPNAPKGMKVLTAEQTAQLMGKDRPTFRYAEGTGIDIWDYIDNASGLSKKIADNVSYDGVTGMARNISKGMVNTLGGEMTGLIKKEFDSIGSLASYVASKGVGQWRSTVIRALKMEGQYSAANVARTLYQMQTESGGNPRAINLWDSNAKKGIPSKGLMQVIDPTFKAYARKGFNKNIYDPLSNILASIRYAVSRYGSLSKAYRGVGYENGGIVTKTGLIAEKNKPEMVIPLAPDKRERGLSLWQQAGEIMGVSLPEYTPENSATVVNENTERGGDTYAPVFNLTISGTTDDRQMARKIKRWVEEALDEAFDSMSRKRRYREA